MMHAHFFLCNCIQETSVGFGQCYYLVDVWCQQDYCIGEHFNASAEDVVDAFDVVASLHPPLAKLLAFVCKK